jgi:hypothetical protein
MTRGNPCPQLLGLKHRIKTLPLTDRQPQSQTPQKVALCWAKLAAWDKKGRDPSKEIPPRPTKGPPQYPQPKFCPSLTATPVWALDVKGTEEEFLTFWKTGGLGRGGPKAGTSSRAVTET